MNQFIGLIIGGGASGGVYSLLAVSLVLAYSTSRVFNFGQAAVAFSAALIYFQLHSGLGWPEWAALVATCAVACPLLGFLWERLVFRHLSSEDEAARIVCGIGVLIVMPALTQWLFYLGRVDLHLGFLDTAQVVAVTGVGPTPVKTWHILGGAVIDSDQLIILGVSVAIFAVVWWTLNRSRLGLKLRSAVDAPSLAQLRRIDTKRMSVVAWVCSFVVAGVAGVLAAPLTGVFGLTSDNYTYALFVAIAAAALANLRSLPIAFIAGFGIGALRSLAVGYLVPGELGPVGRWVGSISGLSGSVPYILLFAALFIAARRSKLRIAGTQARYELPPKSLQSGSRIHRSLPWAVAAIVVASFALGPANVVWRELIIAGMATGIILLSYTVVTGIGGMVSLAQVTFAGLSALLFGRFVYQGLPILLALVLAVVICVAVGIVFALPALRLGGLSLAFATLALALLASSVAFNLNWLNNAGQGWTVERPAIGPVSLASDRVYLVVVAVVLALAFALVVNLDHSMSGRAMKAIRISEPGAATAGLSPLFLKLSVFAVSAGFAAVGGIALLYVSGNVTGITYSPVLGFTWLAAVIIFGIRRPAGAVVAGLVTTVFPYLIATGVHIGGIGWNGTGSGGATATYVPQILFGAAAIGLAKHPYGALSQFTEARARRKELRRLRASGSPAQSASRPVAERPPAAAGAADRTGSAELSLAGVTAGYDAADVIKEVTLDVPAGSITALVGPNGGGKSTLCKVVAGVLPARAGEVTLAGRALGNSSALERASNGLLFVPESRGIFPGLTVDENLRVWLDSVQDRQDAYRRFPQLQARRGTHAGALSGGEQQMLSIAPLLVKPPRVLVVDEPTLGLAPVPSAAVIQSLRDLNQEGCTILLVEEKAALMLGIADHVGAVAQGRLQWVKRSSEISVEHLEAAYVGMRLVSGKETPDMTGTVPST